MKKILSIMMICLTVVMLIACNKTKYMIVFEENGGTSVEDIIAFPGEPITKPNDPIKPGYIFQGWYKDNHTFEYGFAFTTMPDQSFKLYAKWAPEEEIKQPLQPNVGAVVGTLPGGWVSVWNDEFEGKSLDTQKWNYETGGSGWGNNELQYYRPENTTVSDGVLTITAKKESYGGREYTSSRLTTKYKGDWLYGRIQVRAKLPSGRGTWPAIWMMPTQSVYGGWPWSGEIDIMEHVGYDMNRIHSTIHTKKYNHNIGTSIGHSKVVSDVANTFHVYEIIWEPGKIEAFVDGELVGTGLFRYTASANREVEYWEAWPFDQHFFLILNVAIGGNWGGAQGVDQNIFPTSMVVDYVRVYQRDYNYYDASNPTKVENLLISDLLAGSIWWTPATDDYAVRRYEIWVDGEFRKYSNLNQTMISNLNLSQGTHEIKVRAEDFVGNFGEFSDPIEYVVS
jgi:uncharacterized repeat protein (TIGR02543 family)